MVNFFPHLSLDSLILNRIISQKKYLFLGLDCEKGRIQLVFVIWTKCHVTEFSVEKYKQYINFLQKLLTMMTRCPKKEQSFRSWEKSISQEMLFYEVLILGIKDVSDVFFWGFLPQDSLPITNLNICHLSISVFSVTYYT